MEFSVELLEYLNKINFTEHEILKEILNYNKNYNLGNMQLLKIKKDFMIWLSNLMQVRKYLEIGVFTGYSSTAMALSLPDNSQIVACDINEIFTQIAKKFWEKAKVINKIKLYLQPALITLEELISNNFDNFFDLALIDADKLLIPNYVDKCFKLVKPKGVILIDNTFLKGKVLDVKESSSLLIKTINQFNIDLKNDKRFLSFTLPLGDGLTLLFKY